MAAATDADRAPNRGSRRPAASSTRPEVDFSVIFFSDAGRYPAGNRYQLVFDIAEYVDRHGFSALWVPERHFHRFGGIYSNPGVLAAALAMRTSDIRLRAGSVVLPLHHPALVAETWAMVDNLSGGRVDLAFASGWNPNDFLVSPGHLRDAQAGVAGSHSRRAGSVAAAAASRSSTAPARPSTSRPSRRRCRPSRRCG